MPTKPSRTSKLIQAAALAAALVPLGSVAAEATSIAHTFSGGTADNNFDFHPFGGNYEFELFFEHPSGPEFIVQVTDNQTTQGGLTEAERLNNFPDATCVPIADGTETCIDFEVVQLLNGQEVPLLSGPNTFTGFFSITIRWDANTDPAFPNGPNEDLIRMLHNKGSVPGNAFDTDITTAGSYESDPAIGGRDDNFQSFLVVHDATDPVPEPATLVLLTTGVSGLLYRRRRQRSDPAGR